MRRRNNLKILLGLFLCAFGIHSCNLPDKMDVSDFNLICISIDSLRADFLGVNGMPDPVSPCMDRLSQRSINFSNVLAQASSTFFSHRAIFLSRYVYAQHRDLPQSPETLAGCLQQAGWRTGAFVDGGWMSNRLGHEVGFDTYNDSGGGFSQNIIKALQFIDQEPGHKFFVFLHGYDIHSPYNPPKEHLEYFSASLEQNSEEDPDKASRVHQDRALFKGEMRNCDTTLSHLFNSLKQLDIDRKTIVAVFSDHGESLGEHDYVGHGQLYQVQLKIPLIIHMPGQPGELRQEPVESIDLMPSILGLFEIQSPATAQGIDLHLADSGSRDRRFIRSRLSETTDEAFSMDDTWSLIIRNNPEDDELYLLSIDPKEQVSLSASSPEKLQKLREGFEEYSGMKLDVFRTARKEIYSSDMVVRKRLMPARGSEKEITSQEKFEAELRELGYLK